MEFIIPTNLDLYTVFEKYFSVVIDNHYHLVLSTTIIVIILIGPSKIGIFINDNHSHLADKLTFSGS